MSTLSSGFDDMAGMDDFEYCSNLRMDCCPEPLVDEVPSRVENNDCMPDNCRERSVCDTTNECCMQNDSCQSDCCAQNDSCKSAIGIDQKPYIDKNVWRVYLDVSNFHPKEISVSAENHKIIVHAKKQLDCGSCSLTNEFRREYDLPEKFNLDDVEVCFSCDCILIITAPRVVHRCYSIQSCGPARCFVACKSSARNAKC